MTTFFRAICFIILISNSLQGQALLEVDSFKIGQSSFVVETPEHWFSKKTSDEIQSDTTWNYIGQYLPNDSNVYAQIGIQIIGNSTYQPTKKEERKFKKQCQVTPSRIDLFNGYMLNYKPQKVKGCRACPPVWTQVYTFRLNACYTLNVVLFAQCKPKEIDKLKITFQNFATKFITSNSSNLYAFSNINVKNISTSDTLHINDYYINIPIPSDYSVAKVHLSAEPGYSLNYNNTCIDPFRLNIKTELYDTTITGNKVVPFKDLDTAITIFKPFKAGTFIIQSIVQTKRKILIAPGKYLILTINCTVNIIDEEMKNYYAEIVRTYADLLVAANPVVMKCATYIQVPDINIRKSNDIRNKPVIEKSPGVKPK